MPTENRSSNTEMVSDSEMTECQFHNNCGGWCETRRELEHNLCEHCLEAHDEEMASPAQQHKVEPVAWIYSRPEGQVEPVVLLNRASEGDRGSWEETPLYTHADPGDVDQLSQVIRDLNDERDEIGAEVGRLRAKLAERDALLDRVVDHTNFWHDHPYAEVVEAIAKDYKALSASAEPSAAVEIDERATTKAFHDWAFYKKGEAIGRMDGQQAALEGFIAGADWQARAALERKP